MLTHTGAYDRSAIMRDAHRQFGQMRRYGWSWGRCLAFSWARARAMREAYLATNSEQPISAGRTKTSRSMQRPSLNAEQRPHTSPAGSGASNIFMT